MKRIFLVLTWFMLGLSPDASKADDKVPLTVMTYNIRCGSCESPDDVNHWGKRKYLVADLIKKANPDVIGLQEAELFQVRDLATLLSDFDWVGVGRDDGREDGEMNAVLVRKARFTIATQQTLWLSPTPDKVSRGWDAACNRTVTLLTLKNKSSGREIKFLNTHFDHQGQVARTESARQVVELVRPLIGRSPVILVGDLNGVPSFQGYKAITKVLNDASLVSNTPPSGGDTTFNGFGKDLKPGNKIDYVLVSAEIKVLAHRILNDVVNGLFPSDHFPISADLTY